MSHRECAPPVAAWPAQPGSDHPSRFAGSHAWQWEPFSNSIVIEKNWSDQFEGQSRFDHHARQSQRPESRKLSLEETVESRRYPSPPADVYLFGTCLVDLFVPEAGLDAVHVLEGAGLRVHVPQRQSCCGQPAYTSGNPDSAREVARAQIDLFAEPWPIVVASGSCAGMMRHHWPVLFADDIGYREKAREVAERVFEFAEFLLRVLKVRFAPADKTPTRVALHTSCSARREMGTREHGVELLAALPGVERVEHGNESECCGFGGVFSLKHPDISGAMVKDKLDSLTTTGVERVVSADLGCLLNIGKAAEHRRLPLAAEHLASFVRRRLEGKQS
jgi:L-lactate dehydrogenase complex protein LldE